MSKKKKLLHKIYLCTIIKKLLTLVKVPLSLLENAQEMTTLSLVTPLEQLVIQKV